MYRPKIRKKLFYLTTSILFPFPFFYSVWQYRFSLQTCHHHVRVPPTTHPPPRVNIYSTQLQLSALLCYTGSWGGGGGRGPTRRPGVAHILGQQGVVHTSINGKTTLRNLCLRNILFVNTSQSVSNSLNIIIRLHSLRLYIQYLVQWRHIVTSSVDSLF